MTLQRRIYDVALNTPTDPHAAATPPEITVHRVSVTSGDRMRAELEAPRHKLEKAGPYNSTSLWLWAALTRTGVVDVGYQEFRASVLEEYDVATDDVGKPLLEAVDPTRPATAAGLPSALPLTSAEDPPTGLIPTSTSVS